MLEASNVSKTIRRQKILRSVDLSVRAGEVVGFIGPNGAGKTTLIRILSGMSRASSGTVTINGRKVDGRSHMPRELGLVMESAGFVEHLSGRTNLSMLGRIRGGVSGNTVREAMRSCGLDPADRRVVSKYSLGMRQRLSLAQALMERPRVLLLDEPTNGLDVMGIAELRRLIREQAESGTAVFLASHLLNEVELACDRVLIVKEGCVLEQLSTDDLRAASGGVRVRFADSGDRDVAAKAFAVRTLDADGTLCLLSTDQPVPDVVRKLVELGVGIAEIGPNRTSLEEAFLGRIDRGPGWDR